MNSEREPDRELSMLLSVMLDGELTAAEETRLAGLLRDNPDAQDDYLDFCKTHALLRQELGGRCDMASLGDCPDFCVSKNGTVPFDALGTIHSAIEMPIPLGDMGDRQFSGDDLTASVPFPSIVLQPGSDRAPLFSPLGGFAFSYGAGGVDYWRRAADRLGVQSIQSRTGRCPLAASADRSSRAGDGLRRPSDRLGRLPMVRFQDWHGRLRLRPLGPQIRTGLRTYGNHLRQRRHGHPRRAVHLYGGVENRRVSWLRSSHGESGEGGREERGEGREEFGKSTINSQQSSISLSPLLSPLSPLLHPHSHRQADRPRHGVRRRGRPVGPDRIARLPRPCAAGGRGQQ